MKKYIYYFLFLGVLLLSFTLRFYKITENPPALNWDETSIAYNAYSIFKTGKDEWGQSFPVHFRSYGEYKLPAQIYLSIPGIYFFGLNELGVRITPVVYGTLTVLVMFFLGRLLFQNTLIALVSSFLLAISPWHIQLTRASFESSLSTFFVVIGIWLLVKGFYNQKLFIVSMVPFALSVFTYNSARIFTPLFLVVNLFIYKKILFKYKKIIVLCFITFTILLLPLVPFILSRDRSARYKLVSITDDPGLIPRINENRGRSSLPKPLPRLIHNKVSYISYFFLRNYFTHFTPDFLFVNGAPHKQHHVQKIGQLYYFQAPFLIIGLISLFILKHKFKGLLLSWVLLAFIPVSVTNDSIPHALRTLIAAPFYQLITALGFLQFVKWLKNYSKSIKLVVFFLLLIIVSVSVIYYLNQYYNVYPQSYSKDWQYGYKQAVNYISERQDEYDLIVFSRHYGEPHMFTLFYLNYDPLTYQNDSNLVRFETYDWVRVLRFDKFYFPDLGDKGTHFKDIIDQNLGKKILFIGRPIDFPKEHNRLLKVKFLNGEDALDLIEVK